MAILTVKPKVVVKAKPLTIKQRAIDQVNAVNAASTAATNAAAVKAQQTAKQQAAQALGFQHALADITQGDAGRIYDAYGNAAAKTSAYGDLALASTGDSSRSAAEQAQNYLGSVGPDVGAETRPDISGALRALGATAVGDVSGDLRAQGAYAQERQQNVRDAQLMRLADIGANATYQGTQTANQLREAEVTRQSGARTADVNAAITALKEEKRLNQAEIRAGHADVRAMHEDVRARHEDARAGRADTRAADDQRMKDLAFDIELQQKQVDLAATKLANATGEIAKGKAQFELDNAQKVLDGSLKEQAAGIKLTEAQTEAQTAAAAVAKKKAKKTLTPNEQQRVIERAANTAKEMYSPKPVKGSYGAVINPPSVPYQTALKQLAAKYGLSKVEAAEALNAYYQVGEGAKVVNGKTVVGGRPAFDVGERAQLLKLGYSKNQITWAMNAFVLASQGKEFEAKDKALYEQMLDRLG